MNLKQVKSILIYNSGEGLKLIWCRTALMSRHWNYTTALPPGSWSCAGKAAHTLSSLVFTTMLCCYSSQFQIHFPNLAVAESFILLLVYQQTIVWLLIICLVSHNHSVQMAPDISASLYIRSWNISVGLLLIYANSLNSIQMEAILLNSSG